MRIQTRLVWGCSPALQPLHNRDSCPVGWWGLQNDNDCFSPEGQDCQQVSWIWHKPVWWWGSRNAEYLSLPLLPGPLWPEVVAPDRVLSMGQIELNCVLILNWTVWNRTVYMYENGFGINNLQWLICHKTKPQNPSTHFVVCLYLTVRTDVIVISEFHRRRTIIIHF